MELFEFPQVEVTSEATLNYHQEMNIIECFKFPKVWATSEAALKKHKQMHFWMWIGIYKFSFWVGMRYLKLSVCPKQPVVLHIG